MNRIKPSLCVLALCLLFSPRVSAELPPPERLVGRDTALLVTVPDWAAAVAAFKQTSGAAIFNDPAMRPLIERVTRDLKQLFTRDMNDQEQDVFDHMTKIFRGQITFALGDPKFAVANPMELPMTLIVDARDRKQELREFTKRLFVEEAAEQIIREKVAGGELITAITGLEDGPKKFYFALSDSMFAMSMRKQNMIDLIRRKNGDLQNTLAESAVFRANQARFLRRAKGYFWVNMAELVKLANDNVPPQQANPGNPFAMTFDVKAILDAVGLGGWRSLTMAVDYDSQGSTLDMFFNVPETQRKGLFKIAETSDRNAAPPAFVPGDIAYFMRWRKSGEEIYQGLERMMMGISPMMAAGLTTMIDQAGKVKDPNFDFRRQFIGNLGDDIMVIQKPPQDFTLQALASPPTLYLIGSGNPESLLDALVTAQGAMGMMGMKPKNEEFLGKRMIAIPAGPKLGPDGKVAGQNTIYITTARGYMAIGTERSVVEDFIRGSGSTDTLNAVGGFRAASEKAGGLGTGWFYYDNQAETLKVLIDAVKKDPKAIQKLFGPAFFKTVIQSGAPVGEEKKSEFDPEKMIADYIKLLPEFEQLKKYLVYSVATVDADAEGILFRAFTPDRAAR